MTPTSKGGYSFPSATGWIGCGLLICLVIGSGARGRNLASVSIVGACLGAAVAVLIQHGNERAPTRNGIAWSAVLGGLLLAPLEYLTPAHAGYIYGFALPAALLASWTLTSIFAAQGTELSNSASSSERSSGGRASRRTLAIGGLVAVAVAIPIGWRMLVHPSVAGQWRSDNGTFELMLVERGSNIEGMCVLSKRTEDGSGSDSTVTGYRVGKSLVLRLNLGQSSTVDLIGDVDRATITGRWESGKAVSLRRM